MNPTTGACARELTDWYPANVLPVRMGVYELLNTSTGIVFYARWIRQVGTFSLLSGWSTGHMNVEDAERECSFGLFHNRWPWRGLKEQAC